MVITPHELKNIREQFRDKKIVFCSGSFDMTHAGHVLFLEDCKKLGDILVVGVGSDIDLSVYKGKERPILNEYLRLKMVDSLKPVDWSFVQPANALGDVLLFLEDTFRNLEPNFYVINEDAFDIPRRKKMLEKFPKTELVILERWFPPEFQGISTTKIIEKIQGLKNNP